MWQLDLDLEAHGLPKLGLSFLDVKKLAARIVGSKSFEETARELSPIASLCRATAPSPMRVGLPESCTACSVPLPNRWA